MTKISGTITGLVGDYDTFLVIITYDDDEEIRFKFPMHRAKDYVIGSRVDIEIKVR